MALRLPQLRLSLEFNDNRHAPPAPRAIMPAVRVATHANGIMQRGRRYLSDREQDDTSKEVGVTSGDNAHIVAEVMAQAIGRLPAHTAQAIIIKALHLIDDDIQPCDCLDGEPGEENWKAALVSLAEAQKHARAFFDVFYTHHILEEGRNILRGNKPD